jgi:hypothetical protein
VGHNAGLDGCGKSRPHRDSIPGPSRKSQLLYPVSLRPHVAALYARCSVGKKGYSECTLGPLFPALIRTVRVYL